jgi:hypothetical protein
VNSKYRGEAEIILLALIISVACTSLAWPDESKESLYERARKNGGQLTESISGDGKEIFLSIRELVYYSDNVVISRLSKKQTRYDSIGDCITTDYVYVISDVLYGNLIAGKEIVVSMRGGMVKLNDGTVISQNIVDQRKINNGKSYVLFLDTPNVKTRKYTPIGGMQGLYELDEYSRNIVSVNPHINNTIVLNYDKKPIAKLLFAIDKALDQIKMNKIKRSTSIDYSGVSNEGDITGTWSGSMMGKSGRMVENVFNFLANGSELAGTVKGPYGNEDAILDGKINGNQISFNIIVEYEGYKIRYYYQGKIFKKSIILSIADESGRSKPIKFIAMKNI